MFSYFSKYWFDFVFVMTVKEIKARYKRVFFGFLWAILNPILQMIVIGTLFQFFVPIKTNNYFYFLFAGLLPWNFFAQTLNKCTPLMLNERSLIQKAKFPREALVFSIVFSNFFHLLISISLFLLLTILVGYTSIIKLIVLVLALVWLVFFISGISLLTSALFVKYRDVKFFVQAVLPLWFYATPIIYSRSLLPTWLSNLLVFNPMTAITEIFHFVFTTSLAPSLSTILIGLAISLVISFFGVYFFTTQSPYFDDWL